MRSLIRSLAGLPAALAFAACGSLQDYEEAVADLKPESLIEIDGRRVHVERWGSQGRPLVMLHGLGASTYSFREIGPRLGRERQVVAIDLNGFGFTERPREPEAYAINGQVELVRAVMRELELAEADLLGHSYGGYLAMRLARDEPERFGRLVLISPALNMDVAPSSFIRSRAMRSLVYPGLRVLLADPERFELLLGRAFFQQDVLTDEVLHEYRRRLQIEGLRRAYRGFGDALETLANDRVRIEEIEQPVLVLAGRHDQVVPLPALRKMLEDAPDSVRFEILERSGHSGPEEQPDEVAAAASRFLR